MKIATMIQMCRQLIIGPYVVDAAQAQAIGNNNIKNKPKSLFSWVYSSIIIGNNFSIIPNGILFSPKSSNFNFIIDTLFSISNNSFNSTSKSGIFSFGTLYVALSVLSPNFL